MDEIIWEEPPPKHRMGGAHRDWLEELRPLTEHPKRWARVATFKSSSTACTWAKRINNGEVVLCVGGWEAAARRIGEEYGLWVRYLGEEA